MDDATELRSFLSKDLFDWLQGSDALDALLLSASDVYENLHTDHTPSLPCRQFLDLQAPPHAQPHIMNILCSHLTGFYHLHALAEKRSRIPTSVLPGKLIIFFITYMVTCCTS